MFSDGRVERHLKGNKPKILSFKMPADHHRYTDLKFQEYLRAHPDYQECLGPSCGSGQIYVDAGSLLPGLMRCDACGFRTCVFHQIPWHKRRTCQQYDAWVRLNDQRNRENEASLALIGETTKACPGCRSRIEKNEGCDHFKCKPRTSGFVIEEALIESPHRYSLQT